MGHKSKDRKLKAHIRMPLEEDQRITVIGETAMKGGKIAFVVEDDPGKADRYISKLLTKYPQLKVENRFNGPAPGMVSVIVTLSEPVS